MNALEQTQLLLIEDQPIYLAGLQKLCANKFDQMFCSANLNEARKELTQGNVTLAIHGLNQAPSADLHDFLQQAAAKQVPTIILTTTHHWQDIQTCIAWGAKGIFAKQCGL